MKLYRSASQEEVIELVKNGTIEGTFTGIPLTEAKGSSYNGEFGPVVCAYTIPRVYGIDADFILEIEVDENQILGEGFGRYADFMQNGKVLVLDIKEVYLQKYSIEQVKCVGGIWKDTINLPSGKVEQIINSFDAGDDLVNFKIVRQ